eukprot:CAMPEP_0175007294 /NCGR_PEP_ID=MMETSP0005-20121125/6325_1 /TAXON_ID=420556 /ORGANISM="Ochromonas sp., Strain CCMP1393" /LENGTH=313 /DNA_ID=CAMNT_0016262707 /DNA_START=5 /DNA_END=946 /DNA_ORIENTATION=+
MNGLWNPLTVFVCEKLNRITSLVNAPPNTDPSKKRKVLVIQAHPMPSSFSAAICDHVVKGLEAGGHEVRLRKLYCEDKGKCSNCYNGAEFPAILTKSERHHYHLQDSIDKRAPEALISQSKLSDLSGGQGSIKTVLTQGWFGAFATVGSPSNSPTSSCEAEEYIMAPEVQDAVQDLRWCTALVFVYPTWWFNFPAILKGYFDRVMLPGVAFLLPTQTAVSNNGSSISRTATSTGLLPGLTNIQKIGVVTTYGASSSVTFLAGDNARRFLSQSFRPLCASNCLLQWQGLHSITETALGERNRFLRDVEEAYKTF